MIIYLLHNRNIINGIYDFKHIPGIQSTMSDTDIDKLLVNIIETKQYAE